MSVPGKEWRMHSLGQNRHVALHMVWYKHLFPVGFKHSPGTLAYHRWIYRGSSRSALADVLSMMRVSLAHLVIHLASCFYMMVVFFG